MPFPKRLLGKICGRSPSWFGSFRFLVVCGLLLVDLAIAAIAIISLKGSRDYAFNQAIMLATDLARLEEAAISAMISGADITLVDAVEHTESYLAGDADAWSVDRMLAVKLRFHPEFDAIRFADRDGRVTFGTGVSATTNANLADQDIFQRARTDGDAGLIFSKPFFNRSSGRWVVMLARRVNDPEANFAGMVYAVIALTQFENCLSPLRLGEDGVVSLADLDLQVVVRQTNLERGTPEVGQKIGQSEAFLRAWAGDHAAGQYRVRSSFDGVDRIMAYRKLTNYPGYIFVGLAEKDFLGEWHKELARISSLTMLVIMATAVIAWLSYVSRRRLEALNRDLRRLALTDSLTGCASRRHFLDLLEAERVRCLRSAAPFCLLALDIDHFKMINDRHGHAMGDRALGHFADCVRRVLRAGDSLGRLGGEEFAVLLPETGLEAALAVAERIRHGVQSSPMGGEGGLVSLTVSIGVGQWRGGGESAEALLLRADAALYAAKAAGRNAVHSHEGPEGADRRPGDLSANSSSS